MLVERLPGSLQKQRIADREHGFVWTLVLAFALHRKDDEIAAWRDHPREHGLADQPGAWRHHDLGQAGVAVEQRVGDIGGRFIRPKGQQFVGREAADGFRLAPHDEDVALGEGRLPERSAAAGALDGDQTQARVVGQIDARRRRSDIRRAGAHPKLEQTIVQAVLLDQGPGVCAQVGRDRPPAALRQQALPEQHHDRHRAQDEGNADDGELEEAERRQPVLRRRFRHEHVDRRAGERQQRSGMCRKYQRHQQLRGSTTEANRHHDDHRQERRDRAVDADQAR